MGLEFWFAKLKLRVMLKLCDLDRDCLALGSGFTMGALLFAKLRDPGAVEGLNLNFLAIL